ncbi:MAG: hypothetical protein J6S60_07145 [Oscillospiraceae bacterium]|nr:hypothetical protein [Oscillospiraceae bacterium]
MDHIFIECEKEADRDALVVILARNGYTVKRTKKRLGTSTKWTYYIEFWKE